MKKSKNLVKSIGTVCLSALSLAGVCAGSIAFVDYAKTGFTGQRPQTEQTQDNDKFVETYEFIGRLDFNQEGSRVDTSSGMFVIQGYYGSASHIIVPATVSLGEVVKHDYVFANSQDLQDYTEGVRLRMRIAGNEPVEASPLPSTLSFLCADNTIITATKWSDLSNIENTIGYDSDGNLNNSKFPIKHSGDLQTFKKGTDIKVSFSGEGSLSNVTHIKFEPGLNEIHIRMLVMNNIIPEFDPADIEYGNTVYKDGLIIEQNYKYLMNVYKSAVTENGEFVVPGNIEIVNLQEFCILDNLKKLTVPETVQIVEGSLDSLKNGVEVYLPANIKVDGYLSSGYLGDNCNHNVFYLKKIPASVEEEYATESLDSIKRVLGFSVSNYSVSFPSKYVIEDDEYERIVGLYPELGTGDLAKYIIKKSNYQG